MLCRPFPATDEQKFFFDLRGWILLPAVLTDEREIEEMKAEVNGGARQSYGPSLQRLLLDHPAIVGILSEVLWKIPLCATNVTAFAARVLLRRCARRVGHQRARRQRSAARGASTAAGQRYALSGRRRQDFFGFDARGMGTGGGQNRAKGRRLFSAVRTRRILTTAVPIAIGPISMARRGRNPCAI